MKKLKSNKKFKADICVVKYRNNSLSNSKPCLHCLNFLKNHKKLKINKVYFSNEDGKIICTNIKDLNSKHISWKFRIKK